MKFVVVLFLIFCLKNYAAEDVSLKEVNSIQKNIPDLENFINQIMNDFDIPGMSIAVIEDGKIVWIEGFGVLEKGKTEVVDGDTLMKIGSVSKPLTSLMIAKCVDEQKISWDTPIKNLYPAFKHQDLELEKSITLEDLLSMGLLPPQHYAFIFNYRVMDSFKILEQTSPVSQKRERFLYNNAQYDVAGRSIGAFFYPDLEETLDAYKRLMKEKVFDPLKMERSGFNPVENFAYPHTFSLDGKSIKIDFEDDIAPDLQAPAGGIWSTVRDLAKYVILELNGDFFYISKENLFKRREKYTRAGDAYYGLGLGTKKNNGLEMIGHNGTTAGFSSLLSFYPEKQCGLVILCNTSHASSYQILQLIADKIFEYWFLVDKKTPETYQASINKFKNEAEKFSKKISLDEEFLSQYLGVFENRILGKIEISKNSENFILKAPTFETHILRFIDDDGKKNIIMTDEPALRGRFYPITIDQMEFRDSFNIYVFLRIP